MQSLYTTTRLFGFPDFAHLVLIDPLLFNSPSEGMGEHSQVSMYCRVLSCPGESVPVFDNEGRGNFGKSILSKVGFLPLQMIDLVVDSR
jgi:hypothetical protein